MSGQNSTPAGWYPDPSDSQRMRYWDGNNWSGTSFSASPSAANSSSVESSASQPDTRPWWQTWFAIVPGLLLCLPLGLGLWRRQGTSTVVKTVVTGVTVLLLGTFFLVPVDPAATTATIPAASPSDTPSASPTPSTATVPAVKGLSLTKAKRKLRAAGFEVCDIHRRPSSKKKDTVLKQGVGDGTDMEPVRACFSLPRRRSIGCDL